MDLSAGSPSVSDTSQKPTSGQRRESEYTGPSPASWIALHEPTCRSLSAKAETHLPGKHVCGFREFRTRRRSKRDEPERLGLPQRLVGLLNELMDLTRCCLVPTG